MTAMAQHLCCSCAGRCSAGSSCAGDMQRGVQPDDQAGWAACLTSSSGAANSSSASRGAAAFSCCKAWTTWSLHAATLLTGRLGTLIRQCSTAPESIMPPAGPTVCRGVPSRLMSPLLLPALPHLTAKDVCRLNLPCLAACQICVNLRQHSSITYRSYSLVHALLDDGLSFFGGDHVVSSSV